MILQILPDPGQVLNDVKAETTQGGRIPEHRIYGIVTADDKRWDNSFYTFRVDEGTVSVDADAPPSLQLADPGAPDVSSEIE